MTTSKRKKALRKILQEQELTGIAAVVISLEEQKKLMIKGIDSCGYLRRPTYESESEKYFGKCALQEFEQCDYPCHLPNLGHGKYENFECPTYKHFMKVQEMKK